MKMILYQVYLKIMNENICLSSNSFSLCTGLYRFARVWYGFNV